MSDFTTADVRNAVGFIPTTTTQMRFSEKEAEKFDLWLRTYRMTMLAAASQIAEAFTHTNGEHKERRVEGLSHTWAAGYDAACADIAKALWNEVEK